MIYITINGYDFYTTNRFYYNLTVFRSIGDEPAYNKHNNMGFRIIKVTL